MRSDDWDVEKNDALWVNEIQEGNKNSDDCIEMVSCSENDDCWDKNV